MANVFTRRWQLPRNTYGKDFGPNLKLVDCSEKDPIREYSPTRINRPDPPGITIQPSLGGGETSHQIWYPPLEKNEQKRPRLLRYIEKVNFTSGPLLWPMKWEDRQEPPPITYSYASNYRSEYGWPKYSEDWMKPNQCTNRHDVDRFYKVAKGGVPYLAPPKLHDPFAPRRGKLPGVYRCQEKAEQRKVQMPAGCLSNEEAGQNNSQVYYVEASPRQKPREIASLGVSPPHQRLEGDDEATCGCLPSRQRYSAIQCSPGSSPSSVLHTKATCRVPSIVVGSPSLGTTLRKIDLVRGSITSSLAICRVSISVVVDDVPALVYFEHGLELGVGDDVHGSRQRVAEMQFYAQVALLYQMEAGAVALVGGQVKTASTSWRHIPEQVHRGATSQSEYIVAPHPRASTSWRHIQEQVHRGATPQSKYIVAPHPRASTSWRHILERVHHGATSQSKYIVAPHPTDYLTLVRIREFTEKKV
ncbi:hypothetical protein LSAT2_022074 [Lamellibrachia satsuma]|nr:hypothetical protein LSAT2_022074 [Lamellibrachia satsuma]